MRPTRQNLCVALISALTCLAAYAQMPHAGPRTGQFDIQYAAGELVDELTLDSMRDVLAADETITWKVYVPENYDPERPAGLFVYISPTQRGWMPRGWQPVFDDENLIWISADQSGNETHTKKRMFYAALAPEVAAMEFAIDSERIYLSGFSGGGKVAGLVAIHFANIFRGAIYIGGAQMWTNAAPELLNHAKTNRYVFLTGTRDFNLALTKKIKKQYEREDITQTKLMNIIGMGHTTPDAARFREALDFLDSRE